MAQKANTIEDFWGYVRKTDSCWMWEGPKRGNGYGSFCINYQRIPPHRVSYELLVGPIPKGLVIDHLCRTPLCVNPDHLEPVTHRENLLRGVGASAANARKTHCINGHAFDESNTHVKPDGSRVCRECGRASFRRRWQKRKENHD